MAFLQFLLAWIGRSLGSLLNTLFGWAVLALFGRTFGKQHALLVALIAMAAFWPILLFGIPFPRVAATLFTFLSLPNSVREILRALWATLAVTVPLLVGFVLARMSPVTVPWRQMPVRVLSGFPATAALSCAFAVVLFTVPALRLLSLWRRQEDLHVPLVAESERYEKVAEEIDKLVQTYSIPVGRSPAPLWLTLPFRIMRTLGRATVPGFIPHPAFWKRGPLQIALYPHDVLIRGPRRRVAWTRGALVEGLACGPGLQTVGVTAQGLERRLQSLWDEPAGPEAGARRREDPREGLLQVIRDMRTQPVDTEDWQVLYRKAEQFRRILDGEPPLLRMEEQERSSDKSARKTGSA